MTQQGGFTLTDEQRQICEAVRTTSSHVMIDALAGTGKTETLCQAARGVRGFALALAFNKKIAEELTRRLPANFEAKTMNSLGFAELRRGLSSVSKWIIDDRKPDKILRAQLKARGTQVSSDKWTSTLDLLREAQLAGLRPEDPESLQNWYDLADRLWIEEDEQDEVVEMAKALLAENNQQTERGLISFDDQLYWPVVYGTTFSKHEVVFGDEAQDWNWLQHELVRRISKGRLVVAGDPRQSIYAWRGARTDSMGELRESHGGRPWVELGLTMTWRCPKEIVKRQLWHVPRYKASEEATEGRVARLRGYNEELNKASTWGIKDLVELRPTPHATIAVLCRNNAPLWKLAFAMLRQKVPIVMQGRDLGKMLVSLSRKIEGSDSASREQFLRKLTEWEERQRARADEERQDAIVDRAECLRVVAEDARDAGEVRRAIEDLFARTTGALTLSTIHRAKGLEWNMVVHLDSWRVPSKRARKQGGETLQQENNLLYVAETRTRHTLVLANTEDFA